MGTETKIQWTDHTFNHVVGCEKVSEGCKYCYAEVSPPARKSRAQGVELWGPKSVRQEMSDAYWKQPAQWAAKARKEGRRHRVFCASLADWLDPKIPAKVTVRLLQQIYLSGSSGNWLDWQLLTKRPQMWRETVEAALVWLRIGIKTCEEMGELGVAHSLNGPFVKWLDDWLAGRPPSNVWVGCSAESQERLEQRVPHFLSIPAKVRFLSCEPLMGGLDFPHGKDFPAIDWVIVGGESGPKARECNLAWIEDIVTQCRKAKVPVFVKQLGSNAIGCDPDGDMEWPTEDAKGGDMSEWPESLRVREFPVGNGGAL